jgi:hypothetical protein
MKFNCGLSLDEKIARDLERQKAKELARRVWHTAFAFFPVRVAPRQCVWLETYERRIVMIVNPRWTGHYTNSEEKFVDVWERRELVPVVPPVSV